MLFFSKAIWPSIKHSAASGFDQSWHNREVGPGKHLNGQNTGHQPRGDYRHLKCGLLKGDCPLHGDRCWELHVRGWGLLSGRKGLPLLFDSTGRQEIRCSLSIFLSQFCSIPQINGQSPAEYCSCMPLDRDAEVQPQSNTKTFQSIPNPGWCQNWLTHLINAKFLAWFSNEVLVNPKIITAMRPSCKHLNLSWLIHELPASPPDGPFKGAQRIH